MTICVRVYNNEDVRVFRLRDAVDLAKWVDYNTRMRPGCGLIVDGKIIQTGYLNEQRLSKFVDLSTTHFTTKYDVTS